MRARLLTALRAGAVGLLLLVTALVLALSVNQYLFHRHVVRLLADMDAIELHHSTWADAQRLMRRWGRWGSYEGQCTEKSCQYTIGLKTLGQNVAATILVQDGVILQKEVRAMLAVPPSLSWNGLSPAYTLLATTASVQPVARWADLNVWEPLFARHPNYTFTSPSGCFACMEVTMRYDPYTPPAELRQLGFNTDCFESTTQCSTLKELLPASAPYHLYEDAPSQAAEPAVRGTARTCAIPAWARARDSEQVLSVLALSNRFVPGDKDAQAHVLSTVQVLESLSGGMPAETNFETQPYYFAQHGYAPERMNQGQRYLLFSMDDSFGDLQETVPLSRCAVLPDTSSNREQVTQGLTRKDHLRDDGIDVSW